MKIRNSIIADFVPVIFIMAFLTYLFRMFPLDLLIQKQFYRAETGWFLQNAFPWKLLYHHSNLPGLVLAVGSLILLGISFWKQSLLKFRKIFLYFVLIMAIAPGLIINLVLKDNWGRPRPRNIIEFNGIYQYEKPLEIDKSSSGKSFPCGHASMGFYLIAPYFILRKKKKMLSQVFLVTGLLLGGLIGLARIVQGGHYASDVIWAGGIVYLTSAGIYYLLNLDKKLFLNSQKKLPTKKKLTIVFIIIIAIMALILLLLLSTPYQYSKTINLNDYDNPKTLNLSFRRAEIEFQSSDKNVIVLEATGHGFPWSKLKTKLKNDIDTLFVKQRESGYFTEVDQKIRINLSDSLIHSIILKLDEGNIVLSDFTSEVEIKTQLKKGQIIK